MEPSGMRIPEDASLRYEYISPIGECLFPCSAPTVCARGAMPACRWLPAPALELRRGRSPWRPRLPRPGQVARSRCSISTSLACTLTAHPLQFPCQFRLATASTCLGLGCLSVCQPEGIGSHVPQFPRSNLNACGPMSGLPTSTSMALQLVHTRPQLLSTSC